MAMAKGLPMMQRGSPEAAGRCVEKFQFVTGDSFVISLIVYIVLYTDSV